MLAGHNIPGVVTGKPLAIGGTLGHAGATSLGVTICTSAILQRMGRLASEQRVVIQGYGKVGAPLVKLLSDRGMKVVGVADIRGAIPVSYTHLDVYKRQVHFFSRSRQKLWQKGETSGNTLHVVEMGSPAELLARGGAYATMYDAWLASGGRDATRADATDL